MSFRYKFSSSGALENRTLCHVSSLSAELQDAHIISNNRRRASIRAFVLFDRVRCDALAVSLLGWLRVI
jgi:hypothetical protein